MECARQPDYYFSGCRDDSYIYLNLKRMWLDKSVNFRKKNPNKEKRAGKQTKNDGNPK